MTDPPRAILQELARCRQAGLLAGQVGQAVTFRG
jgi:hypothetical protein